MSADGKWVAGLSPDMPLAEAWRLILTSRLGAIAAAWHATVNAPNDAETVHHLRVSCRRADAALAVRGLLPKRKASGLSGDIRRLRRLAGAVRDADVLLNRLVEAPAPAVAGAALLAGQLVRLRRRGLKKLLKTDKPARRIEKAVEGCRDWKIHADSETFRSRANLVIPDELAAFQRCLDRDHHDDESLHQARIHGKSLRYHLELFTSCFDPAAFHDVYKSLEAVQDLLGSINDLRLARSQVLALQGDLENATDGVRRQFETATAQLDSRFQEERARLTADLDDWKSNWRTLAPLDRLNDSRPSPPAGNQNVA